LAAAAPEEVGRELGKKLEGAGEIGGPLAQFDFVLARRDFTKTGSVMDLLAGQISAIRLWECCKSSPNSLL